MTLVQHSCEAPSPARLALEVLAKLQETPVTFSEGESPSLKSVTKHPISGEKVTNSVAWVGCARTISQLVPSLGLWETAQVESWVEAAVNTLLPILSSSK